jgi:RNA 3'-terminal phosphate cyclase (ATP)
LSLLTGRPFRLTKIRANRDKPGLRPQHLSAVEAAGLLCGATVTGASVGSGELVFRPGPVEARDFQIDIGTAGSTALVLQTLHLPLALKSDRPVRLSLTGGTFNLAAPSYPFLETAWCRHMSMFGLSVSLAMPSAGFYPRGGGRLDAWIEPGTPRAITLLERGPLLQINGAAGVARLSASIAGRMRDRARARLHESGLPAEVSTINWPGSSPGAAIGLVAQHEQTLASFIGLGAPGKPAEIVADEAVEALLAYENSPGAIDPHSADQILLPLAMAEGRSICTVTEVTEHLRTNARTITSFLDRPIRIEESQDGRPGRVVVG